MAAGLSDSNMYSESLQINGCGPSKLPPLWTRFFLLVLVFFSAPVPFPCSNPASNKRGLTSVTRAYKSPLLQMERVGEGRDGGLWVG